MTKVKKSNLNVLGIRTSVVVECLRLCTSMQGAQVRSLVGKFHVPLDADKKKKINTFCASVAICTMRAETVYVLITFRFPTSIKVSNLHIYHIITLYALSLHKSCDNNISVKLGKQTDAVSHEHGRVLPRPLQEAMPPSCRGGQQHVPCRSLRCPCQTSHLSRAGEGFW